ncbi:adenosylmethionine decarboxylase [Comamonas sp. SCN 65-56]|uniref:adenosylmethionine decarboxylase n=1 Tax=Comamonas sp. SCN 65-56 TaxID=1660095 RepID=UPI00086A7D71|nr:adenosylmethionine decarboxylase [Comamonas sp. SCN 65-56]ODS90388.1 MAG: S-adenosylmethionine decarboxylase [Comamonas sp. SCN 65-56]
MDHPSALKLHGFNNLTKSLSFNIYDVCYAATAEARRRYIEYIDEQYSSERMTGILTDVASMIGATVLDISRQDYDPQGASVAMLLAEDSMDAHAPPTLPRTGLGHLDKSHITVHTYPESHPANGIATFRADIDVATCGLISPLKALNHLIDSFESEIVVIDYKVRGFTRDVDGRKHYIDHPIASIQQYLEPRIRASYDMIDLNMISENVFHTKMKLRHFDMDRHLFEEGPAGTPRRSMKAVEALLNREMLELYHGRNLPVGART